MAIDIVDLHMNNCDFPYFFHSDVSLPEGTGAQRRIWGIGWNWMMSSYGLDHSPIPDSLVWDIVRRCEVMTPTFSMPTTWRITSGGLAIPKAREAMAPSRYVALGLHWHDWTAWLAAHSNIDMINFDDISQVSVTWWWWWWWWWW